MSGLSKVVFSIRSLAREPLAIRSLHRQTGIAPDELRDRLENLTNSDPLIPAFKEEWDKHNPKYRR